MITKYCKKLKYKRKIVLVTDGRGSLDADESSILEITRKITQDGIELVIVCVAILLINRILLTKPQWR